MSLPSEWTVKILTGVEPSIPLMEITSLSTKLRKQLESVDITDLGHLFWVEGKLIDANNFAQKAELTIQEALETRQIGRNQIERILTDITAKKKVEPIGLLWKVHWLFGSVPESDFRQELIAQESSALSSLLENLDTTEASTIDKILLLLLHRLLIIPETILKGELEQLVEYAERFQRSSLLAYQTAKTKAVFLALAEEEEPARRIVILRKLTARWKKLQEVFKKRGEEKGQIVLTALLAADNLAVLDLSERHLKAQVQQKMTTAKLRQAQLTQITTGMNAAIELRDAYLVVKLADRASKIWFELAQGKSDKAFTDDLLRSLRFGRTAIFHLRALDDLKGVVKQLQHLIHLIGEFPTDKPLALEEAIVGVLKTFINTAPLLDRPADQELISSTSKRLSTLLVKLISQISEIDKQYPLMKLHVEFLQSGLDQLDHLGVDPSNFQELTRELIHTLLRLSNMAPKDEQVPFLNKAVEHANRLLAQVKPLTQINEQDLEAISTVAAQLGQRPSDTLSKSAQKLIEQSHQLNEQLYFQSKDPQIRAQLALQLLISRLSPDTSGKLIELLSTKELDKFEEYASTALLTHIKNKQPIKSLKAGSLLVWLLLQRYHNVTEEKQRAKLKKDASDFAEKIFTFLPNAIELTEEAYPYVMLFLRSVNELVHDERPTDESKWQQFLTQCEQLAQNMAKVAKKQQAVDNQILALSAAATATAKLATITAPGPHQARLLIRATKQIQKAIEVAVREGTSGSIETALSQYDQIMRARLQVTPQISNQISLFTEWGHACREVVNALKKANAMNVANQLHASCLLNTQIPLLFSKLSENQTPWDTIRREIITTLQEANKSGSKEQAQLAKQLERRWAFQLSDDSLLSSGFRLEAAETSFTVADEHFRISLQVEPQITIDNEPVQKGKSFSYLRPSSHLNDLVWYEETPILCSPYTRSDLHTWLTLEDPTEESVTIGYYFIASLPLNITLTLKVQSIEALSHDANGVTIKLAGFDIHIARKPTIAEHRDNQGILMFELNLISNYPEAVPLHIRIS